MIFVSKPDIVYRYVPTILLHYFEPKVKFVCALLSKICSKMCLNWKKNIVLTHFATYLFNKVHKTLLLVLNHNEDK